MAGQFTSLNATELSFQGAHHISDNPPGGPQFSGEGREGATWSARCRRVEGGGAWGWGGGQESAPGLQTHHEGVVGELVQALEVLDEVGAAVVGVSPGHRGAYGTHLPAQKHGVRDGLGTRCLSRHQPSVDCVRPPLLQDSFPDSRPTTRSHPQGHIHIPEDISLLLTNGQAGQGVGGG